MTKEQAQFLVKVTEYFGNQEIDLRSPEGTKVPENHGSYKYHDMVDK
ncbi:MAG: hypothetical protein Q7R95_11425 [bacterium]|nr:hypothetical protein [bacterium]